MSYEELAERITMIARRPCNGARMDWENVAFACLYAAIDAIRMAGVRSGPDVSSTLKEMLDGIVEIHHGGLEFDDRPLRYDGSVRPMR